MQPDLRAECLAMAERGDAGALHPQEAAAFLRRVADALPQEPQGDVVEAMAKGIYEADSEGGFDANDPRTFWRAANSYWPPHVWDSWLAIARAALSAAEPFIQARIAAAAELATAAARDPLSGRAAIQNKPEGGE